MKCFNYLVSVLFLPRVASSKSKKLPSSQQAKGYNQELHQSNNRNKPVQTSQMQTKTKTQKTQLGASLHGTIYLQKNITNILHS